MLALILAGGMGAVWVSDSVANWSVKRRAERAGQHVEIPAAGNLFTQDPPHWSATLLVELMRVAAPSAEDLEERRKALAHLNVLTQGD